VALKDVSSAQAIHHLHLESIESGAADPPGKLYTSHAATALLDTLETGGSCARLIFDDTATLEQRRAFDAFCTKLGEGGLVRRLLDEHIGSLTDVYISSL
jgi:hypothetical protein